MRNKRIEYRSKNGYSGILYGKSSMAIFYPDGREALHTGFRTPNTLGELKDVVDGMPEFVRRITHSPVMEDKS